MGRATRALMGAALLLAARASGDDLEAARALYQKAQAEADAARRIPLLRGSIAASATFEAYLALGQAQQESGALADARASLQKALELAGSEKARAKALYALGETALAEGKRADGIALLRQSLKHHPYPNVAERLKQVELEALDRPASAGEIAGALAGASRAFGVQPSVDLRIGFDLGSATLNSTGLAQARELGRALQDGSLAGQRFEIVGHTDKRGDDAYNDSLSLARAESVKRLLVAEFQIPAARLTAVGRGRRALLYPGDSEEDHALNRRVEVVAR